jgi:hypothetical protein
MKHASLQKEAQGVATMQQPPFPKRVFNEKQGPAGLAAVTTSAQTVIGLDLCRQTAHLLTGAAQACQGISNAAHA